MTLAITVVVVFETAGVTRESLATVGLIALIVLGPLPLLFRSALRTQVRDNGITVRFRPFHRYDRHVKSKKLRITVGASAGRITSDPSADSWAGSIDPTQWNRISG